MNSGIGANIHSNQTCNSNKPIRAQIGRESKVPLPLEILGLSLL